MAHGEMKIKSYDSLNLYTQWWKPRASPKATILFVHGAFEHSGRYTDLAEKFAQSGYNFYAFDLRGHGKSEGESLFISSFESLIKDLEVFSAFVRQNEPDVPFFLMGPSAGAVISIAYILTCRPAFIKGAIFSATALQLDSGISSLIRSFSGLLGRIFPRLRLKKINTEYICRDKRVVADYNNDPLVRKEGLPAHSAFEFLRWLKKISDKLEKFIIPVLILHGTGDTITNIQGSRDFYGNCGSTDKVFKEYPGFYHDLFHEPGNELVLSDIISWLEAHE